MGLVDVGGVVVYLCDSNGSELIPEVVEGNEEDSVILVGVEPDSLLLLRVHVVPVLIVVRPSPLELSLSPGVSQLNQSYLLSLPVQDVHLQQSVGVALHDS